MALILDCDNNNNVIVKNFNVLSVDALSYQELQNDSYVISVGHKENWKIIENATLSFSKI